MAELMAPGGKILAEVLEYDPTVYSGKQLFNKLYITNEFMKIATERMPLL